MPRKPKVPKPDPILTNDLTGAPKLARDRGYRPEYCDLILKFFAELLEATALTIDEKEIEENRTRSEREDGRVDEKTGKKIPSRMIVKQTRGTRRKERKVICAALPSMAKFGRHIGFSHTAVNNWRVTYPSFDEAAEIAQGMLADEVVQRGLTGQYDAEMCKFILKNWCGFKDRTEITGADGAPLNPPMELRFVSVTVLDETQRDLEALKARLLGQASGGKLIETAGRS